MNKTYLEKLEYNKILEQLSTYCNTYIGKELTFNLLPFNEKEEVQNVLLETSEAVGLIERNSTPPISEIDDISIYLKLLESSSSISQKALLSISNILDIAHDLNEYFSTFIGKNVFPHLDYYFSNIYTNSGIVKKINSSILDENTILEIKDICHFNVGKVLYKITINKLFIQ